MARQSWTSSEDGRRWRRALVVAVFSCVLGPAGWAGDDGEAEAVSRDSGASDPGVVAAVAVTMDGVVAEGDGAGAVLLASDDLPSRTRRSLESAHSRALGRVQEIGPCRALFDRLGADGVETLMSTVYVNAPRSFEEQVCGTGVPAYTTVGSRVTFLCRRYGRIAGAKAEVVLIHEALHAVGLDEYPHDRDGLTPQQINALVERSCGFGGSLHP